MSTEKTQIYRKCLLLETRGSYREKRVEGEGGELLSGSTGIGEQ